MTPISQNELIIQNAAARVGATAVIIGAHNAHELRGNDMTTQYEHLESRRDHLLRILQSGETAGRGQIAIELRDIATQLEALRMGTHRTQAQGETLARIVTNELNTSRKVLK